MKNASITRISSAKVLVLVLLSLNYTCIRFRLELGLKLDYWALSLSKLGPKIIFGLRGPRDGLRLNNYGKIQVRDWFKNYFQGSGQALAW